MYKAVGDACTAPWVHPMYVLIHMHQCVHELMHAACTHLDTYAHVHEHTEARSVHTPRHVHVHEHAHTGGARSVHTPRRTPSVLTRQLRTLTYESGH